MAMKAHVRADSSGNLVVHMEGGLDYDNQVLLRKELHDLIKNNPTSGITLDLNGLDFVGSSGIGHFVETLKILNEKRDHIKLSNVRSEFVKVFKLYNLDAFALMEKSFDDDETETLNSRFGNRKRTFQN